MPGQLTDEELEQHEEERLRAMQLETLNQQERLAAMQDEEQLAEEQDGGDGDGSGYYQAPDKSKTKKPAVSGDAGEEEEGEGDSGTSRLDQLKNRVEDKAKQAAEDLAKKAVTQVGEKAAQEAAVSAAAATSEIWVPALLILAGVVLLVFLIIIIFASLIAMCNQDGLTGWGVKTFSKIGSVFSGVNICDKFAITNPGFSGGRSGGAGGGGSFTPGDKLTDAQARAMLAQANIGVNYPQPRTSLEQINSSTIQDVIGLKQACDSWLAGKVPPPMQNGAVVTSCNVVVTAGTEQGHAEGTCSHSTGYKVDLRLDPTVSQFIKTWATDSGRNRSDGAHLWNAPTGSVYAEETSASGGPHWDVLVGCGS